MPLRPSSGAPPKACLPSENSSCSGTVQGSFFAPVMEGLLIHSRSPYPFFFQDGNSDQDTWTFCQVPLVQIVDPKLSLLVHYLSHRPPLFLYPAETRSPQPNMMTFGFEQPCRSNMVLLLKSYSTIYSAIHLCCLLSIVLFPCILLSLGSGLPFMCKFFPPATRFFASLDLRITLHNSYHKVSIKKQESPWYDM